MNILTCIELLFGKIVPLHPVNKTAIDKDGIRQTTSVTCSLSGD